MLGYLFYHIVIVHETSLQNCTLYSASGAEILTWGIVACASIWIISFIVVAILVARAPLGVEIPGKGFYYVKDGKR